MLLAALVGAVLAFFGGWLIFGVLLHSFYESNTVHYEGLMRSESEMRLHGVAAAQLCFAGLLAYIFDRWANIRSFGPGFVGGLIVAGLMTAGFNLQMWSWMNLMPFKALVVDIVANAIFWGLIGGVIGWVLGRGKSA